MSQFKIKIRARESLKTGPGPRKEIMNFFDTFDSGSKRYLNSSDLTNAYYKMYGENAWIGQVQAVINAMPEKKLTRENFDAALEELDRRHCKEQSLYERYEIFDVSEIYCRLSCLANLRSIQLVYYNGDFFFRLDGLFVSRIFFVFHF